MTAVRNLRYSVQILVHFEQLYCLLLRHIQDPVSLFLQSSLFWLPVLLAIEHSEGPLEHF